MSSKNVILMGGNLFGAMLSDDFQYAFYDVTKKVFCLNLEKIHLCRGLHLALNDDTHMKLHTSRLSGLNMIRGESLMNYKRANYSNIRVLLALTYEFCKNHDQELPSGTTFDDLKNHIFERAWSEQKNKTLAVAEGKQEESDEFTENENEDDDNDSSFVTAIDSDKASKRRKVNKQSSKDADDVPKENWWPSGWLVYVLLICKHTRISDDYMNLYLYKQESKVKPKSRKKERRENSVAKKEQRKYEIGAGINDRGITVSEKNQMEMIQIMKKKDERDALNYRRDTLHYNIQLAMTELSKLAKDNHMLMDFFGRMYPGNPEGMKSDPCYSDYLGYKNRREILEAELNEAKSKMLQFDNLNETDSKLEVKIDVPTVNRDLFSPVSNLSDRSGGNYGGDGADGEESNYGGDGGYDNNEGDGMDDGTESDLDSNVLYD